MEAREQCKECPEASTCNRPMPKKRQKDPQKDAEVLADALTSTYEAVKTLVAQRDRFSAFLNSLKHDVAAGLPIRARLDEWTAYLAQTIDYTDFEYLVRTVKETVEYVLPDYHEEVPL